MKLTRPFNETIQQRIRIDPEFSAALDAELNYHLIMKLIDLDPRWLLEDGRRIGVLFRTPQAVRPASGRWCQTCFFEKTTWAAQRVAVWAAADDLKREGQQHFGEWQGCNEQTAWTVKDGAENASFETLSITPSIDGSRGGLWHGFITNGECVS